MGSEERQHLETIRRFLVRRLYKLQERSAEFGVATPPEILLEIEDLEAQIAQIEAQITVVTPQTQLAPVLDFVGREREIANIGELLRRLAEGASVIGIRGMPGIGKTQLALAVAQRLRA